MREKPRTLPLSRPATAQPLNGASAMAKRPLVTLLAEVDSKQARVQSKQALTAHLFW